METSERRSHYWVIEVWNGKRWETTLSGAAPLKVYAEITASEFRRNNPKAKYRVRRYEAAR